MFFNKILRASVITGVATMALLAHSAGAKTLNVAVSVVPQATFVKAVAGEQANVTIVIPPGSNPKNYEPSAKQMEDLEDADVYFAIGVPPEAAFILSRLSKDLPVVKLPDIVKKTYPERKLGKGRDPHIWLSPKRAKIITLAIAEALGQLDTENAAVYLHNAEVYNKKIQAAETQIKQDLASSQNRSFLVYHPAFGYFADDFGLTMYALEKAGKKASAQRLVKFIDLAKEKNIKTVFYQSEMDSTQAKSLATEIGGKAVQLSPLNPNYIDNLIEMGKAFKANL